MRKICHGIASCILSALLIVSCSSQTRKASSNSAGMKGVALGELTVDRCLFYIEGENFRDKSGGDLDSKEGAYGKQCLGMRWGEKATDFVTYDINLDDTEEPALMVIRAAFDNPFPQSYDISLDDKVVHNTSLKPTGGYGYTEKEWNCFSIPLGRIEKGHHSLTLRPSKQHGGILNIDCIAIGRAG